jgi:amphi-Trp domain-containing protein
LFGKSASKSGPLQEGDKEREQRTGVYPEEDNMSKEKIVAKGRVEMDEVVRRLEEILHSLKSGRVRLEHGDEQMVLTPGGFAELEVEASRKEGKQKLSLEVTWTEHAASDRKFDLKISSEERERGEITRESETLANVRPEEEMGLYAGTEAFASEFQEFRPAP